MNNGVYALYRLVECARLSASSTVNFIFEKETMFVYVGKPTSTEGGARQPTRPYPIFPCITYIPCTKHSAVITHFGYIRYDDRFKSRSVLRKQRIKVRSLLLTSNRAAD